MRGRVRERGSPWPAPSFFRVRPLMCGMLCFAAGIAASRWLPYAPWLWAVCAGLAGLAALLRKRRRVFSALLLLALLLLGLARGGGALRPPELPDTGKWIVEGTIDGAPTHNDRADMFFLGEVRVRPAEAEAWQAIQGKLYCYSPEAADFDLAHGQRVSLSGTAYLPSEKRNPGGFDQRMWLAQNGAHVRLYAATAPALAAEAELSLRGVAIGVSKALGLRIDTVLGEASPVARAMLLGDQSDMPEDWTGWLRDSGVSHLLAVSGLHVGLWFMLLQRLIKPIPANPRERWALLAVLLSAYALITGLRPSVLRAVIMLLVVQSGYVFFRRPDPVTTVSAAMLGILLFRPLDLFGAGFQLSCCAVWGMILLRPALRSVLPEWSGALGDGLSATVAAQLGVLPASAYWFGTVPFLGVLTNVLAIPLTGLLIPVAAAGLALDAVWTPLGWFFVTAAKGMVAALMLMARWVSSVPGAYLRVGAFPWWGVLAYALVAFLCCDAVVWPWRRRLAVMAGAVAVALGVGFASGPHVPYYVQLDVRQALSGVLHAGRRCYVYDCGEAGSDLVDYLLHTGNDVDGMFISHPHSDHYGGLADVLERGIPVRRLYVPRNADAYGADSGYYTLLAQARAQGIPVTEIAAGDALDLDGIPVHVLGPEAEAPGGGTANDRSLVLLVQVNGKRLLLTGDATGPMEPLDVEADVLQVGHHGAKTAAGEAFLADATPEIALISVGGNAHGHPSPDTIDRLLGVGAAVYSTRDHGAITVFFYKEAIQVEVYCP